MVSEKSIINDIKQYINKTNFKNNSIVLPLSGGYDSRLLASCIDNKKQVNAFTFQTSKKAKTCEQIVYAKYVANKLGLKWKAVLSENYLENIPEWYELYQCSTHLHGMYHIEFYKKCLPANNNQKRILLSGIVGDLWSGGMKNKKISSYNDLYETGYSHGMSISKEYILQRPVLINLESFYKKNKELFCHTNVYPVWVVRMKLMLLSYLTQLPEYFGYPVMTPFLNYEIVSKMLWLEKNMKHNRLWQSNYFKKMQLFPEEEKLKRSRDWSGQYAIHKESYFEKLNSEILGQYIDTNYLCSLNNIINKKRIKDDFANFMISTRYIAYFARKYNIKNKYLEATTIYKILKPIEWSFNK